MRLRSANRRRIRAFGLNEAVSTRGRIALDEPDGADRDRLEGKIDMVPILKFIDFVGGAILDLMIWAIVIWAILSWLVAFDVVNLRNRYVYQISRMLDAVCTPIMRPLRRFIPPLGGVDITPLIALILLEGFRAYLWTGLMDNLISLAGGVS